MFYLQRSIQNLKKVIPRGWSPILRYLSKVYPKARMYPAVLKNSDTLFLDLSENMCHTYFYYGELPHEKYTEEFFKRYLKPGDVFLDIGANIGYFTRLVSNIVGKEGVVHAFEPMPSALCLLKKNTETLKNVVLHEIALSDQQGTSSFSVRKYGDTSSLGRDPTAAQVIRVEIDTIDNVFKETDRIDMIKIDVEGFEYEVLKGAIKTIRSKRPLLYFEYIDRYAEEKGITLKDFSKLLKPLGYSIGFVSSNYPNSPLISEEPSSYLLAVPEKNRWNIKI